MQDPVLAFRHEDPAVLAAFQPADIRREGKTLVEQLQPAGCRAVDLLTESVDVHGGSG